MLLFEGSEKSEKESSERTKTTQSSRWPVGLTRKHRTANRRGHSRNRHWNRRADNRDTKDRRGHHRMNRKRRHPLATGYSIGTGTVHMGEAKNLETIITTNKALRSTGNQVGGANIQTRNTLPTPHG